MLKAFGHLAQHRTTKLYQLTTLLDVESVWPSWFYARWIAKENNSSLEIL